MSLMRLCCFIVSEDSVKFLAHKSVCVIFLIFLILSFQPRLSRPDLGISPLGKIFHVESVFEVKHMQILHPGSKK